MSGDLCSGGLVVSARAFVWVCVRGRVLWERGAGCGVLDALAVAGFIVRGK